MWFWDWSSRLRVSPPVSGSSDTSMMSSASLISSILSLRAKPGPGWLRRYLRSSNTTGLALIVATEGRTTREEENEDFFCGKLEIWFNHKVKQKYFALFLFCIFYYFLFDENKSKFWLKYAVSRKISFLWQIWTFEEIIISTSERSQRAIRLTRSQLPSLHLAFYVWAKQGWK